MARFLWSNLLIQKKDYKDNKNKKNVKNYNSDKRTDFQKDYDRIVFMSSFRRLQDKAQVFPLEKNDFIRTRLTHSIEVANIASELGEGVVDFIIADEQKNGIKFNKKLINQIPLLLKNAALIHDLGNPPFGHITENLISQWFENNFKRIYYDKGGKYCLSQNDVFDNLQKELGNVANDFIRFDGNAQTLRIVDTLYDENLSKPLLSIIIKYPIEYDEAYNVINQFKKGRIIFASEYNLYKSINDELNLNGHRHPLTYLLEAADDIAYSTSDIQDSIRKGLFTPFDLLIDFIGEIVKHIDCGGSKKELLISDLHSIYCSILKTLYYLVIECVKDNIDEEELHNLKINSEKQDGESSYRLCLIDMKNKVKEASKIKLGIEKEKQLTSKLLITIKGKLINLAIKQFFSMYKKYMDPESVEDQERITKAEFLKKYELLSSNRVAGLVVEFLKSELVKYTYYSNDIVKDKIISQKVINKLLDYFVIPMLNVDFDKREDSSNYLIYKLLPQEFLEKHNKIKVPGGEQVNKIYRRLAMVVDFISGMTDSYAMEIYKLIC